MAIFRISLSSLWGYKKNKKSSNGFLIIEETGDILVKNLFKTDNLGKVGRLTEFSRKKKAIRFKNDLDDDVVLNFSSENDSKEFERHANQKLSKTTESNMNNDEPFNKLKKLKELQDLGILSEEEYEQKRQSLLKEI